MKKSFIPILVTVVVTIAVCTVAAMYTPPGFGHSVTMVSGNGGISRHPVYLGLNRDNYLILVTGTVIPPYRGSFRIKLEGDPMVNYKLSSRYPPVLDLGIHKFHGFSENTISNIKPLEKFALTVSIKPEERILTRSDYNLRFYDVKTDKQVLSIPISFMELDNFNISKKVRRPYPESHASHVMPVTSGTDPACH